jgi:phosphate transport system ATP-binding protein
MDNHHIEVNNLDVWYGKRHVLRNVSLKVPDKKITAIIGPSGCGKTTLLKCLNRMIEAVDGVRIEGEVLVNGENIYDPSVEVIHLRRRMGLLSQRPYPLPMSIYDNVAFGPRLHTRYKRKQLDGLVEHYLRQASLWDEVCTRLDAPGASLSIGQQQRLCLARGLAVEPDAILGDEPTSALDPQSSAAIEQKFVELKERYSIVVVTHHLAQARRIADYVVFIHGGEIIEAGAAAGFFSDPQQQLTRDYIQGLV